EIKLTFPLKAALPHLVFLSNNQGEELNVFLGDPQMSFDFDEGDDDAYKLYQGGRRVTADASGVVTSVEQPDEQKDEKNRQSWTSKNPDQREPLNTMMDKLRILQEIIHRQMKVTTNLTSMKRKTWARVHRKKVLIFRNGCRNSSMRKNRMDRR
ncbi:hypothetical protein J7E85_32975, partial [Paenibacillus sp. ISL-20]|nr:hypothetical protein [Paenibacillus sp. ISL-20]